MRKNPDIKDPYKYGFNCNQEHLESDVNVNHPNGDEYLGGYCFKSLKKVIRGVNPILHLQGLSVIKYSDGFVEIGYRNNKKNTRKLEIDEKTSFEKGYLSSNGQLNGKKKWLKLPNGRYEQIDGFRESMIQNDDITQTIAGLNINDYTI